MKLLTTLLSLLFSVCAFAQEKIIVTQNVPYAEHKSCVMDIAQPVETLQQNNRPAIVIVHGGGGVAGDKRDAVYTNLLVDYAMKGHMANS